MAAATTIAPVAKRHWWGIVGATLLTAALAAAFIREELYGYRLVVADPDALPADASLTAYGATRGAALYQQYCQECHRAGGAGDSRAGVPNLADGDWLYGEGRLSEIERVVDHGIRAHAPKTWNLAEMPGYARPQPSASDPQLESLSPSDIEDVADYLLALAHRPHAEDAAARGREIYAGRGACYDCHSADARGDGAIGAPNLTDGIWLYGEGARADLIDTLEHGRRGVCPAWGRKLGAKAVRELAVYVYTLSHHHAQ